jgi:hypothetical protein
MQRECYRLNTAQWRSTEPWSQPICLRSFVVLVPVAPRTGLRQSNGTAYTLFTRYQKSDHYEPTEKTRPLEAYISSTTPACTLTQNVNVLYSSPSPPPLLSSPSAPPAPSSARYVYLTSMSNCASSDGVPDDLQWSP